MPETLVELVARISADATELKKALSESEKGVEDLGKKAEKETKSISDAFKTMGKSFVVVGGAITASIGMMVKSFASTGSELHDLSLKTGVSIEALAGLKYAAEQNGASLGTVEMAIKRTAMAMSGASDEAEGTSKAFTQIGLSLKDLKGLNPEQQFLKIANAIAKLPDPMQRSAAAVSLFGRSGTDMLPMLSKGEEGLRKMMEEGQRLTGWTTAGAKSADDLGDAFGTLKTSTMGLFNAIGESLAPIISRLVTTITNAISGIVKWAKENPVLSKNISLLVVGIGLLLLGLGGIILLLPLITRQLAAIKIAMLSLNTALGPVGWALTAISLAIAIALPLILSLTGKTDKLKTSMSDLEKQATQTNFALKISSEEWKQLSDTGSLTAEQFIKIANSMGTTERGLLDLLRASGLVVEVFELGGVSRYYYIKDLEKIKVSMDGVTEASDKATQEQIDNFKKLTNEAKRRSQESTQYQLNAIDDRMRAENSAYAEKQRLLDNEYRGIVKNINAQLGIVLDGYQSQIDAINKQTDDEELALTRQEEQKRLTELIKSGDYKAAAEYQTEINRNELLRQRQAEIDNIRFLMDEARKKAENDQTLADERYEAEKSNLERLHNSLIDNLEKDKVVLDTALKEQLDRYDIQLAKYDEMLKLQRISLDEFLKQYGQAQIELGISPSATIPTPSNWTPEQTKKFGEQWDINAKAGKANVAPWWITHPEWAEPMASGGIVTQPTLIMAGEKGTEAIIPLNEIGDMGGITINFTQPVFFDREDTMNKFVRMINKGIQRQERLKFGGAYNG